ncbi:MAG TPA: NADPH-dependent FMN reductase [Patescibacteria group bacterium]
MKILLFNGALERRTTGTSHQITGYFKNKLQSEGAEVTVFNLSSASIPFFDITLHTTPIAAQVMTETFRSADLHIWLTPLYHGSMTGIMKNCLDWLEISAKETTPYLTDKVVGLVCWADGGQAMQGITAMDAVAKSLRAWTLPYAIPAVRSSLYDHEGNISKEYQMKFDRMNKLLLAARNTFISL